MKKKEESVPVKRQTTKKKRPAVRLAEKGEKKVKIDYSDMEVSEYYLKASKRYRSAKYVAFFLLIVFLAVNLLFFRSNITYANLMYLLRDLDTGVVVGTGEFASISYSEEGSSSYGIFKGRLAIASTSGFRLYNSTGARELDEDRYMQYPALVCGNKYAIAYDVGGHSYSIFTTMACVYEGEEENIIEDVCVADNGSYAIMTRSNESKYLISVYKENLKLQSKHYKENFPCDIALSHKGDALAIVSADVSVSGISTEIMLCRPGTEEKTVLTVEGSMPLSAKYMENGNLMVVCDNKVCVVSNGEVNVAADFSGKTVDLFSFSETGVSVVCSANSVATENEAVYFDSEGEQIYSSSVNEKINSVCADQSAIYVLCEDKIRMLAFDGSEKLAATDAGVSDILPLYGGLLKCEKLGTSSVSFE
ncbi:MAG: hypothetical protein IJ389_03280 [Clostridia bacterium]|nr:hypothetical protein [Clostridia bacterium]